MGNAQSHVHTERVHDTTNATTFEAEQEI